MEEVTMSESILRMRVKIPLDEYTIDVDIHSSNRVIGLFGPSGSGKTTLLEAAAGLRRQAKGYLSCQGVIWQDDEKGIRIPVEERGIGYVPQDHLLFPHLNVRRNLEFGNKRFVKNDQRVNFVFDEVLSVLELKPLLNRKISSLSGGEKQRVALGRALCSNPQLLMLDEPLSSLDIQLRHRILPFLIRVREQFKIPILMVSHNPIELQALCDEVIVLRDGRVIAQGSPTDVFTRKDIYSIASEEGFQNILSATIKGHRQHSTILQLGEDSQGPELTMMRSDHVIGDHVVIGFPSNDILIANRQLEGISARNQLAATITCIQTIGHKQLITTRLFGVDSLTVLTVIIELTQDAVEELHLEVHSDIFLIFKSSSVMLYG